MIASRIDFAKGEVRIEYDAADVSLEQLAESLERAGYPVIGPPRISDVPKLPATNDGAE